MSMEKNKLIAGSKIWALFKEEKNEEKKYGSIFSIDPY